MKEQTLVSGSICLTAVGHDPDGRWEEHFERSEQVLRLLYSAKMISLTYRTHNNTKDTALRLGWRMDEEDLPVGGARFAVIRRGLETGYPFINYWDGDRVLYAAQHGVEDLKDIVGKIPQYDCFIAGATRRAIVTHQPSMTSWEEVKSWALGHYLGITGDIANRGCFGFSKEFAQFLVQHEGFTGDETDALFAILPLAFRKLIAAGRLPDTGRKTVGYKAYKDATSYADWIYEGLTAEESAERKNNHSDFMRRFESAIRIIVLAQSIGEKYELGFPPAGERMADKISELTTTIEK